MATIGGANTLKSNLVLHYDAANTRSFRGESTINKISGDFDTTFDSLSDGNVAGFNNQLGSGNYLGVSSNFAYSGSKSLRVNRGTGGTGRVYRTFSVATAEYSTVSAWVYSRVVGPFIALEYFGGDYSWGVAYTNNVHTGSGWELIWCKTSGGATSSSTGYYFLHPSVNNVDTYWDNIQVENKQYNTPYVNGTRGTTVATGGGIIDISNNNKHAELVNGPIYNSEKNGVLYMDGVNDRILYPNSIPNSTVCTVVMWIATTDLTFLWMSGNDCGYYLAASDTPASNYWHSNVGSPTYYIDTKLVINPGTSADGNFHMFEAKNVNLSTWTTFQFLDYCGGSSWNLNGKVGLIQIYNRNLTAEESLQNYNANKNRFI